MTAILAVETSTPACSVALRLGDVIVSRYSEEPRSHTKLVMNMISDVLAEAGLSVQQLDMLAVTVGPGSFTGLRIGFAAVQGLAFGADKPVVHASSLQVMAATYLRRQNANQDAGMVIMPVLDARMAEFNCGCYKLEASGELTALVEDQLLDAEGAMALYRECQPDVIVGEAESLIGTDSDLHFVPVYPDAVDLLTITQANSAQPVESIELVYLRGTDAWQKRKKLRKG